MMVEYSQSIDFLNTGSSQIRFHSDSGCKYRMGRIEVLIRKIGQKYRLLPKEIKYGTVCYQGAVKADQAGPYLSLFLFYHLQTSFLAQKSLAGDNRGLVSSPDRIAADQEPIDDRPGLDIRQVSRELYGNAIMSITDMLTLAKLIADGVTISSIKPFFMPRVRV